MERLRMLALAPRAVVLGALLHAHPTARLAGPLLRRRASFMVEQSVSSSVSRFEEADSLLDVKVPQIDPGARDRTMVLAAARTAFMFADNDGDGFLDYEEVKELMQRMMGNDDPLVVVEEVRRMFCLDDGGCRSNLTYEDFVLLLKTHDSLHVRGDGGDGGGVAEDNGGEPRIVDGGAVHQIPWDNASVFHKK